MNDAIKLAITAAILAIAPVWTSNLYLRLTQHDDPSAITHKLRGLARYLPFITISIAAVSLALAFLSFSSNVVPLIFLASIISLGLQLLLIPVALISAQSREIAASSNEGIALRYLIIGTFVAAKFAWTIVMFVLEHFVRTRSGCHSNPNRNSPYGYHGYESYSEKAQRTYGGPDGL